MAPGSPWVPKSPPTSPSQKDDATLHSTHASPRLARNFIAWFGDTLIEKTGARVWTPPDLSVHLSPESLDDLDRLLEEYASALLSGWHGEAAVVPAVAKIIRQYRRELSESFSKRIPAGRSKSGPWIQHHQRDPLYSRLNQALGGGYKENVGTANLARLILTRGGPFRTLVTGIRRRFYSDDLLTMKQIEGQFEEYLCEQSETNGETTVVFNLDWKPSEFFESQFEGRIPRIGSLVTLTGSAFYAQATTCAKYLKQTWPETWELLLSSLQSCLDSTGTPITSRSSPEHSEEFSNWYEVNFSIGEDKTLSALIKGPLKAIMEVAQQLSWMSAALSLSPSGKKLAYCKVNMDTFSANQPVRICRNFAELDSVETPCWLSLFSNATIAQGFPIPQRLGETGLEVSIELMAAIVGARHAVEYDGGVVMKGLSSMFIPIKRDEDTNTVQWHLVSSQNEETRLSYQEGVSHCPDRILLADFDLQSLQTTRAIVGWCRTVETVVGREYINYENIDYSTVREVGRPLKLKSVAVGLQQAGLLQFGFTLGPKDGSGHFQR